MAEVFLLERVVEHQKIVIDRERTPVLAQQAGQTVWRLGHEWARLHQRSLTNDSGICHAV